MLPKWYFSARCFLDCCSWWMNPFYISQMSLMNFFCLSVRFCNLDVTPLNGIELHSMCISTLHLTQS